MSAPDNASYQELMAVLREATKNIDDAGDDKERLRNGLAALRAVIVYLCADPEVIDKHLMTPLAYIENAVHDVSRGAKPALFSQPPETSKPTGTVQESVQGSLAWALELLRRTKKGTESGAKWVAEEARKVGLRDGNGEPPSPGRIMGWRKECRSNRAPKEAQATYDEHRRYDARLLQSLPAMSPDLARKAVERSVRTLIRMLASHTPGAVPKPIHRSGR